MLFLCLLLTGKMKSTTDFMSLSKAEVQDLPIINVISMTAKAHWGYPQAWLDHWKPEMMLSAEYLGKNQVLKLVVEEEIVGFCALVKREQDYEIEHLWLLPSHMGKGYGKSLLQASIEQGVAIPAKIMVVSDPNAESFYAKMGFQTTSEIESFPKGRFLPVMWKTLN